MNTKFKPLLIELNEQLSFLDAENEDVIVKCEKAIQIIIKSIEKLKKLFIKSNTKSQDFEIHFFKNIKPQFTSKLIYYNMILNIEIQTPHGGERITKKYLNKELKKLKCYFDNNIDFYNYHRIGSAFLDYKYFVRGNYDVKLRLDSLYFEADQSFSTWYDFKVAEILAYDLIQIYLETKLQKLNKHREPDKSQHEPKGKLVWTAKKVALIELLFALHSEGVFNNGAADLKDIAAYFEQIFEVDLGQYRRAFLEIKARKSERTKFLLTLSEKLIHRMDSSDDLI